MVRLLELGRWHITEGLEEALVVVPCDPLERRELEELPFNVVVDVDRWSRLQVRNDLSGQAVIAHLEQS